MDLTPAKELTVKQQQQNLAILVSNQEGDTWIRNSENFSLSVVLNVNDTLVPYLQ
jgi:hypothetical protein